MNVTQIKLTDFTCHDSFTFDIPDTGTVVVRGSNGSGKSSLIEAVAWATWKKTLRGTSPARGKTTRVVLKAKEVEIDAGVKNISWSYPGEDPVEYESATKAREALANYVGEFSIWRRANVFSSSDALTFSKATDAERKKLLEALMGFEHFDAALQLCRAAKRDAEAEVSKIEYDIVTFERESEFEAARIADAKRTLKELGDDEEGADSERVSARIAKLESAAKRLGSLDFKEQVAAVNSLHRLYVSTSTRIDEYNKRSAKLDGEEACPVCGSPINDALIESIRGEIAALEGVLEKAKADYYEANANLKMEQEEVSSELYGVREKLTELKASLKSRKQGDRIRMQCANTIAESEKRLRNIKRAWSEKHDDLDAATYLFDTYDKAEEVLGLKGVRAHVISKVLDSVEAVANSYLTKLAPGMRITLNPYKERQDGAQSAAITMLVDGAGGGFGYDGASSGERRRIDIALLLALARVAGAFLGRSHGTLFLDEVFDGLDEDGVGAVAGLLEDISRDRAVVVITHSVTLAEGMHATTRYELG